MKKYLKKMVPRSVFQAAKRQKYRIPLRKLNRYRNYRELHFSNTFRQDLQSALAGLMITSHVLEKGITMPNRRYGFAYERVRSIIANVNHVINRWGGQNTVEIQATLADLKQYLQLHNDARFELPKDIKQGIEKLMPHLTIDDDNCFNTTREQYFRKAADFEQFAYSRHSVRWFSDQKVDDQTLMKAIRLAQTAPSACNRQATRVKIIENKAIKQKICDDIQNGNRGFGDKADKWLLITSEQGDWSFKDTNSAYIDAGIFTMNLLYALHHYGIVACTLNAHLDPDKQRQLQQLLGYPETEIPVVFIAIGMPTEEFMVCKSRRLRTEDIVQKIL